MNIFTKWVQQRSLANGPPWHTFRQSFIFNPYLKSGGLKTDILVEISTTILWAITLSKNTQYKLYLCIYVPVLPTRPPKQASGSGARKCMYGLCFVILSYAFWKESATLVLKNAYILRFFQDGGKSSTRKSGQTQIIHEGGLLKRIKQSPELTLFLDANLNLFCFFTSL